MMTIGDFARAGRVSVRMLRHYDHRGLLTPAQVDDRTGYRSYAVDQLVDLNRLVALKDLGFTLDQVADLMEDVGTDQMRGMLRLRRAEVESDLREQRLRLDRIEARLRLIEGEDMPDQEVIVKTVDAQRFAALSDVVEEALPELVGPVVQPLFVRACVAMDRAGVPRTTPVAWYVPEPQAGETAVRVLAGFVVTAEEDVPGMDVIELPATRVATVVHHGAMTDIFQAYQALARWADLTDDEVRGWHAREIYLESDDHLPQEDWITEVQLEVADA